MSLAAQAKLLRVLESGELYRVGGTEPIRVDARVVSASNRSLLAAVRGRSFRDDLYYRLDVLPVCVPPLRERKEDIPLLATHFCRTFCAENGKPVMEISGRAMAGLMRMDWPGNVRQLQNVIERAVIMSDGGRLDENILGLTEEYSGVRAGASGFDTDMTLKDMERELILRKLERTRGNRTRAASELGISVRTLRNKLNLYTDQGVEIPG
jgi:DNA-binding NtrC family response regulator